MFRRIWVSVILVFGLCLEGMPQSAPATLSAPAYHNLPTSEGYFRGTDGARLFYRLVGDKGDPIIFLHGGPGLGLGDGGYDMEPLAEHGYRLLMFNQRGAGRSEILTDPARLGIASFVQDVEEFRKQFKLEHFAMIGLSWGSAVALKYMVEHPDRVTRVVFLSPIFPTLALGRDRGKYINSLKTEAERKSEKEASEQLVTANDANVARLCQQMLLPGTRLYLLHADPAVQSSIRCAGPAAGIRNMDLVGDSAFDSLGDFDFRPQMKAILVPALVIEGAETKVPLDATREWAKTLPNGRLLLIPNAGHMNWIDQPEAVLSAMDQFFRGDWPKGTEAK